jgi:hypothetical protein
MMMMMEKETSRVNVRPKKRHTYILFIVHIPKEVSVNQRSPHGGKIDTVRDKLHS